MSRVNLNTSLSAVTATCELLVCVFLQKQWFQGIVGGYVESVYREGEVGRCVRTC